MLTMIDSAAGVLGAVCVSILEEPSVQHVLLTSPLVSGDWAKGGLKEGVQFGVLILSD
jgi:hypothetical protein